MTRKTTFILLALIIFLGFFLRAYKLDSSSFTTDEFLDLNSAYGYSQTSQWVAWDFNLNRISDDLFAPRDERAWMYKWQVAQIFHFFPINEVTARSISVAWGLISILLLYFSGKYFTGKKEIGLIAAFLFAVSIAGITFDRILRMYAMFFPIFLLFAWFLYRLLEEDYLGSNNLVKKIQKYLGINVFWIIPTALLGMISLNLNELTVNIGIVFLFYCLVQFIILLIQKKSVLNKYGLWLIFSIAFLAIFYFAFPIQATRYLSILKFFKFNTNNIYGAVSDYINPFLAYLFIFSGLIFLLKDKIYRKKGIWIFSCFFGILLAATTMWKIGYGLRLIFFAFPFGILLSSAGIYYSTNFISKRIKRKQKLIFGIMLTAIFLILPNYQKLFFQKNFYQDTNNNNYREIFKTLRQYAQPGDFLMTRNFRNYYFANENFKVYNVGKQEDITPEVLTKIMSENKNVWAVFGEGKGYFDKKAYVIFKNEFNIIYQTDDDNIYNWTQ